MITPLKKRKTERERGSKKDEREEKVPGRRREGDTVGAGHKKTPEEEGDLGGHRSP